MAASKLLSLPPITGLALTAARQHVRQAHVDAVDHLAGQLGQRVEALQRLAGDLPVLGVLELDLLGRLELGRRGGELAVGHRLARAVLDDAVRRRAFRGRHFPFRRRRRDQHLARDGTAFADILLALADAAAAAGRKVPPDAVAADVLARRRIFRRHLRPVALELLGHELGEAGERALPHLGAGDADHHLVVGMDHYPGVQLLHLRGLRRGMGEGEAKREAAGDGRAADQEAAASEGSLDRHDAFLPQALAAAWIASRTC